MGALAGAVGRVMDFEDNQSKHSMMNNLVAYHPDGWVERYARLFTLFVHRNYFWLRIGVSMAVVSFGVFVVLPAVVGILAL